jgi:hypothetical protein
MTLRDFISDTLVQISSGIQDAQKKTSPNLIPDNQCFNPRIVPYPINSSGPSPRDNLYNIDLEIAITVGHQTHSSGKIGIVVVPDIDLSFKNSKNTTNTFAGKIKFTIPMIYPSIPNPHPTPNKST